MKNNAPRLRERSIRQPRLILCDEPTGNLDAETAATVADLLISLHARLQAIMVLVTHNEALGSRFARRWAMNRGVLTTEATGAEPR